MKKTAMQQLIEFCISEAFNVEGQDGTKYLAIDYEELRERFPELLEKEREQIEEANIAGMEFIPVDPNRYKEDAEQYFKETYE